jgi:hypothetical protein
MAGINSRQPERTTIARREISVPHSQGIVTQEGGVTRKLLNLAFATALMLFLAVATLWAISYQRQGWAKWTWCGSSRCYTLL